MTIIVQRKYKKGTYTIGNMYVDGVWFCNTLEDTDRGLKKGMPLQQLKEMKVYGETAIPAGEYVVDMERVSQKYLKVEWLRTLCKGKMPYLKDVPAFDGILIHPGTTALDSKGCILVGVNKAKGKVLNSRVTFASLYAKMRAAADRGDTIVIKIG